MLERTPTDNCIEASRRASHSSSKREAVSMKLSPVVVLLVLWAAPIASAQTENPLILAETATLTAPVPAATPELPAVPAVATLFQPAVTTPIEPTVAAPIQPTVAVPFQPAQPSFFRSIGRDVTGFFSTDTAKIVGMFAVAGLVAHPMDRGSVERASENLPKDAARIGNWGGKFYLQAAGGLATYALGHVTGNRRLASVGGDLVRAQMLSQALVQAGKFTVGRERPDASNSLSFPSGHTSSAFATATVLQRHFGWKAGVPAYAFAGFVGASRMASSKHYLSDVLVGAGIGVAVGRTVTWHVGREQFAVGAAPTRGGAMVTLTKR
jgi:membrane-associated phospholipid phosphatase